MYQRILLRCGAALAVLLLMGSTAWATPISSSHIVSFITTPGTATGDVVVTGGAVFVGIGSFGVGTQSVVRIDGGGTTVLADGFNSLAGLAYDAANDRLILGDNGGDIPGAVTGDTIYAIPSPFGSPGTPALAASLELLPAGSIPGFADLILDPTDPSGNTLFVTDASGNFPPAGKLLEVAISTSSTNVLQTSLDFAAGLAADGTTLYVGEALLDFSGQVSSVPLASPGGTLALLASLVGGEFDLEVSGDGSLLATSGELLLRIDPSDGSSSEVVSGFGFATGLFEDAEGIIYALDGFAAPGEDNRIWVFTLIPEPGTALLVGCGFAVLAAHRRCSAEVRISRGLRARSVRARGVPYG